MKRSSLSRRDFLKHSALGAGAAVSVDAAMADSFADKLFKEVMKDRARHPDESIFETVTRSPDSTGKVLVLEGTVVSFEKGSRAKRYFIGFGAGKAYCTIQARFIDKETGEEVVKTNFDGELSMSFFGGSADEAVEGVVKSFIEYFDDFFENEIQVKS